MHDHMISDDAVVDYVRNLIICRVPVMNSKRFAVFSALKES